MAYLAFLCKRTRLGGGDSASSAQLILGVRAIEPRRERSSMATFAV
jgi:hypothetical protein